MFRMLVGTIWHKYMYNKWYGSYKIDLIYDFLDQKTKCDVKKRKLFCFYKPYLEPS